MGKLLEELSYNPRVREAFSLAIYMILGGVLALYVRAIYRRFGISVSNRDAFSANFAIVTIATSQARTFGSSRITTPSTMRITPGVIVSTIDGGLCDIPRHIDAMGHMAIASFG